MTDNELSIERYRNKAAGYDASAEFTMPLRRRTIGLLKLQPGQTVLDVGAGTGLSYALLREGVGDQGRVLGFEQSPEMFAVGQDRVAREGWANVWHTNQPAETMVLPALADAVLFNYTHDICRTPAAVANIFRQVRPGARVAMAGIKFFPWWTGPLNLLAWLKNRPYNAKAADLWSPWSLVAERCDKLEWQSTQWGMGYIASAIYRGDRS
ncbi:methyltransferase domain-containing protein [Hydrogenophaga sp.]|uniref:class I SAM-dependent methyltransferase n=1 Tax=Hydrogenophaga sp. TaxID=1904254 RepID=UPI0025C0CAB7|nr:methyltransferase domain-containing protein [Hydrogenophaga sp.]